MNKYKIESIDDLKALPKTLRYAVVIMSTSFGPANWTKELNQFADLGWRLAFLADAPTWNGFFAVLERNASWPTPISGGTA